MDCRYCGIEVEWRESKAGKRYLANRVEIRGETGRTIKSIYPAHVCKVADQAERDAIDERIKAEKEAALERGEIMIGQEMIVFKGRKYPIGTKGKITWIAQKEDQFGVIKVRLLLESGEQIYINKANIQVAIKEAK